MTDIQMTIVCDYCNNPAVLVDSKVVYGRSYGMIYLCQPCDAYVGTHKASGKPLGRLATAELRKAKIAAHAAFDPLWKGKVKRDGCSKGKARGMGYKWLADQLGIKANDCHIGMFDVETCRRVVDLIHGQPE